VGARALDAIVLLDAASARYHTLTEVPARIWEELVAGVTPAAIVDRLYDEYDAPREQLARDVTHELERFRRNGLIEPGALEPGDPSRALAVGDLSQVTRPVLPHPVDGERAIPVVVPSVPRCGYRLVFVKARLRAQGFLPTLDWLRRRVENIPATEAATVEAVRAVEWQIAVAGAIYPGRALCLEQSLTLYDLLRRQGVAVRYCQGVQPYPFHAHAWIEYRGEPINDVEEHIERFARFPELLP